MARPCGHHVLMVGEGRDFAVFTPFANSGTCHPTAISWQGTITAALSGESQHDRAQPPVTLDEQLQRPGQGAGELGEGRVVGKVAAADAIDAVADPQPGRRRGRTGGNVADDHRIGLGVVAPPGNAQPQGRVARPLDDRLGGFQAAVGVFVLGLGDRAEARLHGAFGHLVKNRKGQPPDPHHAVAIDFRGHVGGPVIALVQIGVQKERGNAAIVERVVIGIGLSSARRNPASGRHPGCSCLPSAADRTAVREPKTSTRSARNAPIMSRLSMNLTRLSGRVGSAVQCFEPKRPFSSPSKQIKRIDRRGAIGMRGKGPGQLEDARGAAGVVVGAGIDRPRRVVVARAAVAQVIVMGADDDRLILQQGIASRQQGEDIAVVVAKRLEVALLARRPASAAACETARPGNRRPHVRPCCPPRVLRISGWPGRRPSGTSPAATIESMAAW